MAQLLHGWGSDLAPGKYSKAVAAVGVLEAFGSAVEGGNDVARLTQILVEQFDRGQVYWHSSHNYLIEFDVDRWRKKYPDPNALAEAWDRALQHRRSIGAGRQARIVLRTESVDRRPVSWHSDNDVFDALADGGPRNELAAWSDSSHIDALVWGRNSRNSTRRSWRFPLRVGFTDEREMRRVRSDLEQKGGYYTHLFRYSIFGEEAQVCDLLFTSFDPDELAGRSSGAASAVVFLRSAPAEFRDAFDLINGHLGSAAVSFIGDPVHRLAVIQCILTDLTHDDCLDVALWNTARDDGVFWTVFGEPPPAPIIIGDPTFLEGTRLRHTIERAVHEYGAVGLQETAAWMGTIAADVGFLKESLGATSFVDKVEQTRSELRDACPARWIQAAKAEHIDLREHRVRMFSRRLAIGRIVQNTWSIIKVWIGPKLGEHGPGRFPDHALGYFDVADLDVLLQVEHGAVAALDRTNALDSPPTVSGEDRDGSSSAAIARMNLPRTGSSNFAYFAVWMPEGRYEVYGQLVVLFKNRSIQTARITIKSLPPESSEESQLWAWQQDPYGPNGRPDGSDFRAPRSPGDGDQDRPSQEGKRDESIGEKQDGITVQRESIIRSTTEDLVDMSGFDATLLASGKDDELQLATVRGAEAKLRAPKLTRTIQGIQSKLEDLTRMSEARVPLDADWLRELLWVCAGHGVELRKYFEKQLGSALANCNRLQLVSRHDAYLPIEFTYDGQPPSDRAVVCGNAGEALKRGACASCPHSRSKDHICPMHFWGLNRVIERHAESGKSLDGEDFVVRGGSPTEQVLTPRSLLHAESDRAYNFSGAPTQSDFHRSLSEMVAQNAKRVQTWDEWQQTVNGTKPNILFLVPHIEARYGLDSLEIGSSDLLQRFQIDRMHVGPSEDDPQMLVLLGCRSAQPLEDFATFAAAFRDAGADVVVTTLSSIRGEDALPIAQEIAKLLAHPVAFARMGGWMMALRRRLLLDGLPVGLGLVAYGDADWRMVGAS